MRNNVFALGGEGIVALGKAEPHVSFTMYHNVLLSDGEPVFAGGYGWDVRRPGAVDSFSNVVWDLRGTPVAARPKGHGAGGDVRGGPVAWDAWQRLGLDRGSVVADPRLKDPAGGDFLPAADSPAFGLGFRPIDLSRVGPRPPGERD